MVMILRVSMAISIGIDFGACGCWLSSCHLEHCVCPGFFLYIRRHDTRYRLFWRMEYGDMGNCDQNAFATTAPSMLRAAHIIRYSGEIEVKPSRANLVRLALV